MLRIDDILEKPVPWLECTGLNTDVVISSRLRLARNLKQFPFPNNSQVKVLDDIVKEARQIFQSNSEFLDWEFSSLDLFTYSEKQVLLERRFISPEFAKKTNHAAISIDESCNFSIMINEEDHFRIQILDSGMDLEMLWQSLNLVEEQLNQNISFAYDSQFGYLASNPLNSGSGLRVSVLLHLPALKITGGLGAIMNRAIFSGMMVNGFYGKGQDETGYIYQIYNNLAIGWNVPELLQIIIKIVRRVVDKEQEARQKLQEYRKRIDVEDKVFRSLGILERARKLRSREFMEHYSNLKLGTSLDIITEIDSDILQELLLWVQPAHLQYYFGDEMSLMEQEIFRAEMVRSRLGL